MIRRIGYFWSFVFVFVFFVFLDLAGLLFFGFNPMSTEAKMIAAVVIVWATDKDSKVRASKIK